ncbi:Shikimate kinase I [hydrothermal vent metagenome]|uniref:shikimate kinase n=2 Tax=hydrothermal vent metagenome TaxID=652676 RepID=A0A3B0VLA3_9ZZZZ
MGAGKTTVGSILANKLDMPFYDVDSELERRCGVSVNLIFEIEQEQGFRKRENQMLADLLDKPPAVIATGGGIVVLADNLNLLRQSSAKIIYLRTEVKQQLYRLRKDKKRPLLQGDSRKQRLLDMAAIRNPLYESIATTVVKTGHQSAHKMATIIIKHYL